LLVTVVEMSSHAERGDASRGHGTAWEALDALGEGVLTTDADGRIVYANKAAEMIIGKPAADALGHTLQEVINLVDEGDRKTLGDPVRQCISTGARVHIGRRGMVVSNDGGGERSIELTVSPLRDPGGEIAGTVIAIRDVSDLRGLTRQMSYQASHDALTGLVNRREFERRLQESLEAAHAGGQRAVLCYLDLDRFKAVNDAHGHQAGSALLREVGGILKRSLRGMDVPVRYGGDEFVAILPETSRASAGAVADRVGAALREASFLAERGLAVKVSASFGVSSFPEDGASGDDLLRAADRAMYRAKELGRDRVVVAGEQEG
jgi:diguanylate cyclase (GGDEF)-like protein/PAS domain S-box-containing protein